MPTRLYIETSIAAVFSEAALFMLGIRKFYRAIFLLGIATLCVGLVVYPFVYENVETEVEIVFADKQNADSKDTEPTLSITATAQGAKYALYVNYWAASSKKYRHKLFKLIEGSSINALVIDVKNEYGHVFYDSKLPMALALGSQKKSYVKKGAAYLEQYKKQGHYLIARLSVFKDDLFARQYPQWAIQDEQGDVWRDGRGLAWMDPFQQHVQAYNIAIALDVARMGFDEIHFDYTRFPGVNDLIYSRANNQANRVAAINGFLHRAQQQLMLYQVKTSIATYGYSCWNNGDTYIGHRIDQLAKVVDYISPMLYPSSFQVGIPGFEQAVYHPYEIVLHSLRSCAKKFKLPSERFRPWLQAFKDYSYDRRRFGAKQVLRQIEAAQQFNGAGWLLWNPASRFEKDSLPLWENKLNGVQKVH